MIKIVNEKEFDIRKPNSDYSLPKIRLVLPILIDIRKPNLDYSAVEYNIGYCFEKYNLSKTSRFHLSIRKNLKKNVLEIYAHYFFKNVGGKIRPKPYEKVIKEFDTFEEAKNFAENLYKS
jgi:hypothetical protein